MIAPVIQIAPRWRRNAVFAPAFFGTTPVLFLTALSLWLSNRPKAAALFALSGLVYLFGGMGLTLTINVPMNEALAGMDLSDAATKEYWLATYVPRWTFWNTVRTFASAIASALVLTGLLWMTQSPSA